MIDNDDERPVPGFKNVDWLIGTYIRRSGPGFKNVDWFIDPSVERPVPGLKLFTDLLTMT